MRIPSQCLVALSIFVLTLGFSVMAEESQIPDSPAGSAAESKPTLVLEDEDGAGEMRPDASGGPACQKALATSMANPPSPKIRHLGVCEFSCNPCYFDYHCDPFESCTALCQSPLPGPRPQGRQ